MNLASLMKVQIQVQLERGETSDLSASLNRLNGLAQRLEDEPFLISQLVRIAMITLYTDAVSKVLAGMEPHPELYLEIKDQLSRFPEPVVAYDWINGERIYMLAAWRSGSYLDMSGLTFEDLLDEIRSVSDGLTYLAAPLCRVWDEWFFYQTLSDVAIRYQKPYPEIDWLREERLFSEIPALYFLSRGLSHFRKVRGKIAEAEAHLQLARTGLALYESRLGAGTFPDDLSGISDAEREDPFTAKSLKYEKTEAGFRLYSLGPNRIDDGGIKDRKSGADDLLWTDPNL
ncbi:MAG: hypothetical protein ACO3N7_00950 [Kiritimatiellia bacterium]